MNYRIDIRPDALADIEYAGCWYENQQAGMGTVFSNAIRQAINTLPSNPLIYSLREPGVWPPKIVRGSFNAHKNGSAQGMLAFFAVLVWFHGGGERLKITFL